MTIVAGAFLFLFGGLAWWLLTKRYPAARFMRVGYAAMSIGGLLFVVWSFTNVLIIGLIGLALLLSGSVCGIFGAFRKEIRLIKP